MLIVPTLAPLTPEVDPFLDRIKFWLRENLGYRFMAEAKRLWELERPGEIHLTTIQTALVLNIVVSVNGLDRIVHTYLLQALVIAHELDLFGTPQAPADDKTQKARTVTAWPLFNFQVARSFYFFRTPFLEHPPKSPLPDPVTYPQWYGEIWLRYPRDSTLTPTYLGCTIKVRTALRTIMNDMTLEPV